VSPASHLDLVPWLHRGGARFPKLVLDEHAGERAVHACAPLAAGELLLHVPRSHLMTQELAQASVIGRRILAAGLRPEGEETYLAAFLLQERYRPRSFWKPFLDALPASFPTIPVLFNDRMRALLKGSLLLGAIAARRRAVVADHALLRDHVPGCARLSLGEFVWAHLAVITRVFGLTIEGSTARCLVPMADMFNHQRRADAVWAYADGVAGFVMAATTAMPAGAEVHDSYGAKCNSRFFLNYGFTLDDNDGDNEAVLHFGVPADTPSPEAKQKLLGLDSPSARRSFQIAPRPDHEKTRAMLSFLRVACADDRELATLVAAPGLRVEDVAPVSAANEARVLSAVAAACGEALSAFDTTVAEDDQLLQDPALSRNVRNCIVMRRGEKKVLGETLELTRAAPHEGA
jgi:histone-lysine N-methyltransferase SETD3